MLQGRCNSGVTAGLAVLVGMLVAVGLPVQATELHPGWLTAALLSCLPLLRLARWRLAGLFLIGGLWLLLRAAMVGGGVLPASMEGQDIALEGRIVSIPEDRGRSVRFLFAPEGADASLPSRIRLSWYGQPPALTAGERWRLTVRLKTPRGFLNPGGFDYERWLFRHGIQATGYVRDAEDNRRLQAPSPGSLHRIRQALLERLRPLVDDHAHAGLVAALALGHRAGIGDAEWETLFATGTNHLLAISGLHVGIVFGLGFLLVRRAWSWVPGLALRIPAPRAAVFVGLGLAVVYAALAGFSVPTRRALVMVGIGALALVWGRKVGPAQAVGVAALLVLLVDPLGVMDPGFWLSFSAVVLIFFAVSGRVGRQSRLSQWWRLQLVVGLGLLPWLVLFFQRASWVAPLVNLAAVPWVSLVSLPLTLLGTLLAALHPSLAAPVLGLAATSIDWLMVALERVAGTFPAVIWQGMPSVWVLVPAIAGLAWLLGPPGTPARRVGLVLVMMPFLAMPTRPAPGEAAVTLLDVGQGMALVVETADHVLLYDTGPRFSAHFNAGEAAVLPFLRERGIDRLDRLVVSNADNDHAGGLKPIVDQLVVGAILSGEPDELGIARASACRAGQAWEWDGVRFSVLHPARPAAVAGNDASCVIAIRAGSRRMLITGDIEARAEGDLAERGLDLDADLVTVPHHGSRTSSTPDWLDRVDPDRALLSVGHANRFGHPHAQIVQRYRERGIGLVRTDRCGAIRLMLGRDVEWQCERDTARLWRR